MMGDGFPVECAGFLVAKELDAFAKVLDKAARPVLAISGGAKVSDKIQLIKNLYEDDCDTIVVVAVGSYQSDVCSYSSGRAVMSSNVGFHDLDDGISYFSNSGSCVNACTSRRNTATRCDVMTEEVLVPGVGAPTTGSVFDRFPQSSGMMRLVSTPLWSLRPFMCPLWLTIDKVRRG